MDKINNSEFAKRDFHFGYYLYRYDPVSQVHSVDQYDELLPKKLQPPVFLQVAISNYCNLKCKYCYSFSSPNKTGNWTFETLYNVIYQAAKDGLTAVAFGGGEPFAQHWFVDLLEKLHINTPLSMSVTSNGTLITEEICDRLQEIDIEVRVSINTKSEFVNRKAGVELLLKNDIDLGINTILSCENELLHTQLLPEFCKDNNINDILFVESRDIRPGALLPLSEDKIVQRIDGYRVKFDGDLNVRINRSLSHLFRSVPDITWYFPPELTKQNGFFGFLDYNKNLSHNSFCPSVCRVNIVASENSNNIDFMKYWSEMLIKSCINQNRI